MVSDFRQSVLLLGTVVVFACWISVTFVSRQPGHMAVAYFLLAAAAMVLSTAFVVWHYYKFNKPIPFLWLLATAILLRLVSIFGVPLFEDDYYRYMWDGYQTIVTNDPYTLAPAVFFDREDYPEIFDSILSLINYPEIATVYGPVTQWVFALGYLIQPASIWPLQLTAGVADIAVIVLLYKLGAGRALLFYAWSPLILKEFSLTAHPDIYAILAMVLSIYLVKRNQCWLAGIALALGVGAKIFAVLALPYLLSQRWSLRYWSTILGWFFVTLALVTLAFGTVTVWTPEGLQAMADSWLFNSAVYLLLLEVLPFQSIKLLLLGVFAGYILFTGLYRLHTARNSALQSKIRASTDTATDTATDMATVAWQDSRYAFRGDWLFMLFLMALPVVNAWYVAWLLPFATLFPRWWSWGMSYFCLLSYLTGANLGYLDQTALELPTSIVVIEYLAVTGVFIFAWVFSRTHPRYRPYARV